MLPRCLILRADIGNYTMRTFACRLKRTSGALAFPVVHGMKARHEGGRLLRRALIGRPDSNSPGPAREGTDPHTARSVDNPAVARGPAREAVADQ